MIGREIKTMPTWMMALFRNNETNQNVCGKDEIQYVTGKQIEEEQAGISHPESVVKVKELVFKIRRQLVR